MPHLDERWNILLILTDQQRYDTLGCCGASTCQTPNIDSLAARGVRFDSAYTAAVACSPSRATLFTGVYPHQHGVGANEQVLNTDIPNLAGELQRAGYKLGYVGKWHVDQARVPSQYGFEGKDFPGYGYPPNGGIIEGLRYHRGRMSHGVSEVTTHYADYLQAHGLEPPKLLRAFYGESPNPHAQNHEIYALHSGNLDCNFESLVSEETIRLLRKMKRTREDEGAPFFIWANYWGPHTPCMVPEPYYSMYDPTRIPEEPSFAEDWFHKPVRQKMWERLWGLSGKGWAGWRDIVARYWGYVTMIDDLVGRVLSELDELGLTDSTLVVFSSDHGDMMGSHRIIEKGPFAYEEVYRLPLVAAHPACEKRGSVSSEFVCLHDLFATFLEIAGLTRPNECDSRSILDNIRGRDRPTGRDSIYGYGGHGLPRSLRMVRTRTHKLVLTPSEKGEIYDLLSDPWEVRELYDLANDPLEMRNLIDVPEAREAQDKMMTLMRGHMVRLDDPMLGYLDSIHRGR